MDPRQRVRMVLRGAPRSWLRPASDDWLVALVRGGNATAFEILYDRHSRELLSFCRFMLSSQHDAEDAVQLTFASAYSALLADERSVTLRPWLFAIARNQCLSVLRQRRPVSEIDLVLAPHEDVFAQVQRRDDLRHVLANLHDLPEHHKAALVLAELHGFSHRDISDVLGVSAEQVKSYVYQARSSLISEKQARDADCQEIRRELATARGAALLKSHLRRHLRSCAGCRDYSQALTRQRRRLGCLLPVAPSLALKRRAMKAALGNAPGPGSTVAGASVTGTATELAGGGAKLLVVKLLTGVALLGAGTSIGTLVVKASGMHSGQTPASRTHLRLLASIRPATELIPTDEKAAPPAVPHIGTGLTSASDRPAQSVVAAIQPRAQAAQIQIQREGAHGVGKGEEGHGKSEGAHGVGKGEVAHGKSEGAHGVGKGEVAHGKSEGAHGVGKGEGAHGKSEEPHGKSEEGHGESEEPHGVGKGEVAHGESEEPHGVGKSEEAPGNSEEAPGNSEEPHGVGKSEEAPGKSEEAPGAVMAKQPTSGSARTAWSDR
jgi:RNA polymerase sigma factor (sigma-70 family)